MPVGKTDNGEFMLRKKKLKTLCQKQMDDRKDHYSEHTAWWPVKSNLCVLIQFDCFLTYLYFSSMLLMSHLIFMALWLMCVK